MAQATALLPRADRAFCSGAFVSAKRRLRSGTSQMAVVVKTNGIPFWLVGAPPILVYSGDWDVHWGYDLAFDPWPNVAMTRDLLRKQWMTSI